MMKSSSIAEEDRCDDEHGPEARAPGPSPSNGALARAAGFFRACGDLERLRLLERLGRGERCVSELAAELGEGLSTVSQRLRLLRAEGLVQLRRQGKHVYYALADRHVADLLQSALDHAAEPHHGGNEG